MPCGSCGSSDAVSLYADGHTKCWSCQAYTPPDGAEPTDPPPESTVSGLVPYHVLPLPKRHLTSETCEKWDYGVGLAHVAGETVPCHVVNLRAPDGRLTGQKLRLPGKDFRVRGKIEGLYGQHLWTPNPRVRVVVTEGEIDALSVSQAQGNKWPVVSVLKGSSGARGEILAQLEWLSGFLEVVLMFDNDEPGRAAAEECAKVLPPGKAKIAKLPLKDANDMIVASRTPELLEAFWRAPAWKPAGIVMGEEAWKYVEATEGTESVPYGFAELDRLTYGHRMHEIVVVAGGTGSGKSTFVRKIILDEAARGQCVGVIALEETVDETALALCSQSLGKPLHLLRSAATSPEMKTEVEGTYDLDEVRATFMKDIAEHVVFLDHQGSLDSDDLLAKMRYMVHGLGCRRIIFDHITIAVSNQDAREDERKIIDRLMTKLAGLVKQIPVGIIVVCHLKRPDKGKSFEEGFVPHLNDLRGSSLLEALSMTVIATVRNQMSEDAAERNRADFWLLKNRHAGATGRAGSAQYDPATCRLGEDDFEFDETL